MGEELKGLKHLEEREVNQKVDEELKNRARQCTVMPRAEFDDKVDRILSNLPADDPVRDRKKLVFRIMSKPIASIIALAVGVGAIGVSGAVGYYQMRMKEMTDAEIGEYNDMLQIFGIEGDSYSRKLSVQELERLVELQEAYTIEDRFPEGSITILDQPEEWTEDTVAYSAQNSTVYLPEWELSDEELLEIVDFYQKQSYSVNGGTTEKAVSKEGGVEPDDVQMANIAEAVRVALQIDVSQMYYTVAEVEDHDQYMVIFIDGNQRKCTVSYGRGTEKISYVMNMSKTGKKKAAFDEAQIQEGYVRIQECLASPVWEGIEIEHAMAEYYLHEESNTIWDGRINYLLEGQDGRGYLTSYDCAEQKLISVKYSEKAADLFEGSIYANSMLEENKLTREILELQ